MPLPATSTWHLVVPVKDSQHAKSRLQPPAGVQRADLALAFALDTLEVVLRVVPADHVVVVTSDPQVRSELTGEGVQLIADPGRGLNAAITAGIDQVVRNAPGLPGGVLLGDLPALDEDALYDGLRACAATESAIVPDHDGTGTVLLAHHDAARLRPSFGTGSAARHARGATVLDLDLPRLRTDVDDDASLRTAVDLGVGPRTQRVLSACSASV